MNFEESIALQQSGKLYIADTPEVAKVQQGCLDRLYDYNHTRPTEPEKRQALLKEMFAEIGEGCYIEPRSRIPHTGDPDGCCRRPQPAHRGIY